MNNVSNSNLEFLRMRKKIMGYVERALDSDDVKQFRIRQNYEDPIQSGSAAYMYIVQYTYCLQVKNCVPVLYEYALQ